MLTTAAAVRLKIQDIPKRADLTFYGDGTAAVFSLPHANVISGSAYVPGAGGSSWTATGCTYDATGFVAFSGVISANSAWRAVYTHSTFSEDEIGQFTAVGGSINGAALEAVDSLLFDGLKRARWVAPDGVSFDDTKAVDLLLSMRSAFKDELSQAQVTDGDFASWAEGQGDW